MDIAIIANDKKKELIAEFCIAYCGVLSRHNLCATATTGKYISDSTGLEIERLLSGSHGGEQQIASRIAYDEVDILILFRDPSSPENYLESECDLVRLCDLHNIPVATNIATAEALIMALDRGDLDWRNNVKKESIADDKHQKAARHAGHPACGDARVALRGGHHPPRGRRERVRGNPLPHL